MDCVKKWPKKTLKHSFPFFFFLSISRGIRSDQLILLNNLIFHSFRGFFRSLSAQKKYLNTWRSFHMLLDFNFANHLPRTLLFGSVATVFNCPPAVDVAACGVRSTGGGRIKELFRLLPESEEVIQFECTSHSSSIIGH